MQEEPAVVDEDLLNDSVVLIPDEETERADLETSFCPELLDDPVDHALSQRINDLAIDKASSQDENKAPVIDSGRQSPLPLIERLKLKYKAQGQAFPLHQSTLSS